MTDEQRFLAFIDSLTDAGWRGVLDAQHEKIRRVYDAVLAAEREACAAACEAWRAGCDNRSMQQEGWAAAECANAIRQRSDASEDACGGRVEFIRSSPVKGA